MSLQEQITQLCKAILTFEKDIQPLKQELFGLPVVTKQMIWNHIVGQTFKKAMGEQIRSFFIKHGVRFEEGDIEILMWVYSSNKENALSIDDLWQIFKPLTIKFLDQIMIVREKKISIAKFHEAHYKISDLLTSILTKTLQFLRKAEKMKLNIVAADPQAIMIKPLDPPHLQIYLNNNSSSMILKEVQIIFAHMLRNQIVCLKNFQQYFIPLAYKGGPLNPNYVRKQELAQQLQGIQLIKYHAENVHYTTKQKFKKPLYLQTKTSLLSTQNSFNYGNLRKAKQTK